MSVEGRQCDRGLPDGDGFPKMGSYPANHFHGDHGASLSQLEGHRNDLISFSGCKFDPLESFCPALIFGTIAHSLVLLQLLLHEQHEIVRQADKGGLHAFGRGTARPGFLFVKLVFDFIKGLFDIPTHTVKMREHSWRHVRFGQIGDELKDAPALPIPEAYAPQSNPAGDGADQFVGKHACVDGIL